GQLLFGKPPGQHERTCTDRRRVDVDAVADRGGRDDAELLTGQQWIERTRNRLAEMETQREVTGALDVRQHGELCAELLLGVRLVAFDAELHRFGVERRAV